MGLFKEESFVVDMPADKAQQVFEKITGEFGKLVRDSYDKHPFTGTIKPGSFSLIPNRPSMAVKLKGTFTSEGMGQTRVTVNGAFTTGRLLILILVGLAFAPICILLGGELFQEEPLAAALIGTIMLIIFAGAALAVLKFPKSSYNFYTLELMRKLDKHELIL